MLPHGAQREGQESKNTQASSLGDWVGMLTRAGNVKDGAAFGEKICSVLTG